MKFARYLAHGDVAYGVVDGDTVREITTTPFEPYEVTDHAHGLSEVKLLPPTAPSKILAVGLNYYSHLETDLRRSSPSSSSRRRPLWRATATPSSGQGTRRLSKRKASSW